MAPCKTTLSIELDLSMYQGFSSKFGRQRHEWLVWSANPDVSVADGKLEANRVAQCL